MTIFQITDLYLVLKTMTNMVLTWSHYSHNMVLKIINSSEMSLRPKWINLDIVVALGCLQVNRDQTWPQLSTKLTLIWFKSTEPQFEYLWLFLAIKKGQAKHGPNLAQPLQWRDSKIKQFLTICLRSSGHSFESFRSPSGSKIRVEQTWPKMALAYTKNSSHIIAMPLRTILSFSILVNLFKTLSYEGIYVGYMADTQPW